MGSSSAQINDEIESTRSHLDANLDVLEKRATSGLKRAGMMGGIGLAAGLIVGGIVFFLYRRTHPPTVRDRVQDAMPDFGDFQKELKKRFGNKPFKIVITSADADERGSVWESTARKVAPTIITSAASAMMAAAMKRRGSSEPDRSGE
jgi:hypothetical protein